MRSRSLRRLRGNVGLLAAALVALLEPALGPAGGPAVALAEPSALRIEPPERLRVADRGEVVVEVAGVDASLPVLLSIDTEGEAVAAVRARITRSEAEVLANGHLRFRAPILARSQGTAVLLVRSLGYACEGQRCQARRAEARVVLRVEGR